MILREIEHVGARLVFVKSGIETEITQVDDSLSDMLDSRYWRLFGA